MLPVIVIVGRPNVGKSTLFNLLTKSRDALVADFPGVTRDRQYGEGVLGEKPYIVVDTGGIAELEDPTMAKLTDQQVRQAITEADVIMFMLDAKSGLTASDELIARELREYSDKVQVVVNKADHLDADVVVSEFFQLGLGTPHAIAATRKRGVKTMMEKVLEPFPEAEEESEEDKSIKIAVVGRPNVGKSTLINAILGEERVVVCDRPGTTRDSIFIPFERRGQDYTLIDTAGVRRRTKIKEAIEKFSIIKTMQAMGKAHVVVMVFNAKEGISDQDMRLIGLILEMGKALVMVFNKWDDIEEDERAYLKGEIDRRLPFVDFARRYFISALHGTGVGMIYRAINEAYESASKEISTGQLTKALEKALSVHQPPLVRGRRIRLNLAHIGRHHPLTIIVHGKQTTSLPGSYKRYLANYFRKTFDLVGVPLLVELKKDVNPYSDK